MNMYLCAKFEKLKMDKINFKHITPIQLRFNDFDANCGLTISMH